LQWYNGPKFRWADTWNLANRFIEADSYSQHWQRSYFTQSPNHKATDDTRATVNPEGFNSCHKTLRCLPPSFVYRYGDEFEGLAEQVERCQSKLRPAYARQATRRVGLYAYYQADESVSKIFTASKDFPKPR